jgi:PAS domain S-box-containing protein
MRKDPAIVKVLRMEEKLGVFSRDIKISKNKKSIDLIDKDDKIKYLFDLALDMLCVADINTTKFLLVNESFTRLLGYQKGELIGESFLKFVHPDDRDLTIEIMKEKLSKGLPIIGFENRYICKDGSIKSLEWTSHPIVDQGLTYAVARDITERKETTEQIKTSEESYRNVFEKFPEGILTTDNKGFVNSINLAGLKLFGLSKSEVVGRHFTKLKILRKRDIPKYIKLFHDIIINKRTGPFLVELINQETKQIVIAEVFCSLILENDKIKGIQAVSRDITDKKKVLEDLKNSEEKYRSIVEMSPTAICTIDLKDYMVSCNKSFFLSVI